MRVQYLYMYTNHILTFENIDPENPSLPLCLAVLESRYAEMFNRYERSGLNVECIKRTTLCRISWTDDWNIWFEMGSVESCRERRTV